MTIPARDVAVRWTATWEEKVLARLPDGVYAEMRVLHGSDGPHYLANLVAFRSLKDHPLPVTQPSNDEGEAWKTLFETLPPSW